MSASRMVLWSALAFAFACEPEFPGEPVGTFDVTGTLETQGCGQQAIPAQDPVRFRVELRREENVAYWHRLPDAPLITGDVRSDGTFRFRHRTELAVIEPDPLTGAPGCRVERSETVEVKTHEIEDADAGPEDAGEAGDAGAMTADAGAVALGLSGDHLIEVTPVVGSNCLPALVVAGGPYLELPCMIEYTLEGR